MLKTYAVNLSRITFLLLLAASLMGFGVGLQPTTIELEVVPGDRNRQIINIANVHTEQTISLTVGLADWALDENGQIALAPPGDSQSSAANWVRFSPAALTLKPGESEQIIVDISTPSRLPKSGDYRFALIASTILPEERAGQAGVWKKYQLASLFYLTTGPAQSEPKILNSSIVENNDGTKSLELNLENTGNAHARLKGHIDIGSGGNAKQIKVGNLVVLDQAKRNYVARLPRGTSSDALIEVKLSNIFAPQANDGLVVLPPYRVPEDNWKTIITPQIDAESLP